MLPVVRRHGRDAGRLVLRGDVARLSRCTAIITDGEGTIPRCKPFKYTYEKEIVMYAYFRKLDYFSTECVYAPNAYRGHARTFLKDLEAVRPSAILGVARGSAPSWPPAVSLMGIDADTWLVGRERVRTTADIIYSGEALELKETTRLPTQTTCTRCGYIASNDVCKACVLLEGLNRGLPKCGVLPRAQPRVPRLTGCFGLALRDSACVCVRAQARRRQDPAAAEALRCGQDLCLCSSRAHTHA